MSGQGYSYDPNGNVTGDATGQRFAYDAENHQKEFFVPSNSGTTPDATYIYDGEGKRVKKTSSTETTVFVYDGGGQMIAEYSTVTATTPQVNYITQDHLGSPRVITNENGTVIDRKDYAAFGDETISAQRSTNLGYTTPDTLREGYTGYEKDSESGLDYAQARYYNSSHGRFTSVDPLTASATIKNPQTFNRYSYVLNSPYKFVDPLGLIPDTTESNGSMAADTSGKVGAFDGGAREEPFGEDFAAMALGIAVEQALNALVTGTWVPGIGLTDAGGERTAIGLAIKNMLENGNTIAQKIAVGFRDSNITIGVGQTANGEAYTDITSASSVNSAIAAGNVAFNTALGYLSIFIPQSEFANSVSPTAAIESTLVHEGTHAQSLANVIVSVSNRGTYDKSNGADEVDAKTAAAEYEVYKGGNYVKHGQASNVTEGQGLITTAGNVNSSLIQKYGKGEGTIRTFLGASGVKWK